MGSGSEVFWGITDQVVPFLSDQGPKFVTLLESRIRNLGTKLGSVMKKTPRYDPDKWIKAQKEIAGRIKKMSFQLTVSWRSTCQSKFENTFQETNSKLPVNLSSISYPEASGSLVRPAGQRACGLWLRDWLELVSWELFLNFGWLIDHDSFV